MNQYLKRFSKREDDDDFKDRKDISYVPAFGKVGINKLKNTFYSRMSEIIRKGGSKSYQQAIAGEQGGVDLFGSSMNSFLGQEILPELMVMKKVGIWVDKPALDGNLLSRNQEKRPYLYFYRAEDIYSWATEYWNGEYVYTNVLLRDCLYDHDPSGLPKGTTERYRHAWLSATDGKVHIQMYIPPPEDNRPKNKDEAEDYVKFGNEIILDLNRIPFVVPQLNDSLLADASDYQIGMLNLASADMNYSHRGNFPTYVEQFDPIAESDYLRGPPVPNGVDKSTGKSPVEGTALEGSRAARGHERLGGSVVGRRYPKGVDPPSYIAPPDEPLLASMKKQEQMKAEIFELIDIAAANAVGLHASAESKQMDNQGLESGLSYIGLELEWAEREIAKIWELYENGDVATVKYPTKYSLKTDEQRLNEAQKLNDIKSAAPSKTFAKEVTKEMARVMLGDKIPNDTLTKIQNEIDSAEYISSDPDLIKTASELGMVDAVTGSTALGFNGEKVVPKAQEEHAKRLALIAESQAKGAARGNPDGAPIQGKDASAKAEKDTSQKDKDNDPNPAQDKTRGPA